MIYDIGALETAHPLRAFYEASLRAEPVKAVRILEAPASEVNVDITVAGQSLNPLLLLSLLLAQDRSATARVTALSAELAERTAELRDARAQLEVVRSTLSSVSARPAAPNANNRGTVAPYAARLDDARTAVLLPVLGTLVSSDTPVTRVGNLLLVGDTVYGNIVLGLLDSIDRLMRSSHALASATEDTSRRYEAAQSALDVACEQFLGAVTAVHNTLGSALASAGQAAAPAREGT